MKGIKSYFIYSFFIIFLLIIILINPKHFSNKDFIDNFTYKDNYENPNLGDVTNIKQYIDITNTHIISGAILDRKQDKINESQKDEIIEKSNLAIQNLRIYEQNKKEENLFNALFLTQEANSKYKSFSFINCVDYVIDKSEKYTYLFYYLSQHDKNKLSDLSSTKSRLMNFLDYHSQPKANKEEIISLTKQTHNIEDTFNLYDQNCNDFKTYLSEDFRKQRMSLLTKITSLILLAIIFFFIGRFLHAESIRKSIEKSDKIKREFSSIFSPKEINKETIEKILSLDSIITTILTFLSIIVTIISSKLPIVILVIIILCVMSLLLSILFGVVSLNSEEYRYKQWCYKLFIFSILFFVFFVGYLIFLGGAGLIINEVISSLKYSLSNQTIK